MKTNDLMEILEKINAVRNEKKATYTCCLCGKACEGMGNNPWPVVDDPEARCCDACNSEKVIVARLKNMFGMR